MDESYTPCEWKGLRENIYFLFGRASVPHDDRRSWLFTLAQIRSLPYTLRCPGEERTEG